MREQPTWRIPFGVLLIVVVLTAYCLLVARLIAPLILGWSILAQLPIYLLFGLVWLWLLPFKRFLKWMETGNWR